ncbi:outer membrane protein assembly factor BamE [Brevundimonas sp.]|uniref:outer membrane protein assembly factor BamE n=1 Tax=Brevundimonas sp. TaxID=1871086 RepID=UPI001E0D3C46|nr:outer membrane protein assembly factor BamE [Brevundimonas sp.]MBL0947525.1 outer membrane protein assembly factor BamE [Brevundimonas sp.]
MNRSKSLVAAFLLSAGLVACAPVVGVHGFQAVDVRPADIVAGTDTKETVLARLGSPSATSVFEEDSVWYYISQTTRKYTFNRAFVAQRNVTEITFDEAGNVAGVRTLGLQDGEQIAMNRNQTPTRGRELTIIEQLLGNVGRGQLPRTDEDAPGQRRPD